MLRRCSLVLALAAVCCLPATSAAQAVSSTATSPAFGFESGPVRPLLLSPSGDALYVLNSADHRLEVYAVTSTPAGPGAGDGFSAKGLTDLPVLTYVDAVFTGLEPVSMALHPSDPSRLFVVNAVSDSLAVIDLVGLRVLATVAVGDEPQDVAVVGDQVVVATARAPGVRDLLKPSDWDEDAVVFVSSEPPYAITGQVSIAGHKPRALAVVDGLVHVVPLDSGNHTTILSTEDAVSLGLDQLTVDAFDPDFEVNPGLLSPGLATGLFNQNPFGQNGWIVPDAGRIVFDQEYPFAVPQLPDVDVHRIDPQTHQVLPGGTTGVGTTLLAMARNPITGELWIANTDARNRTRFEPMLKGAAFDNQVTIVGADGVVSDVIELAPPLTSVEHAQPVALAFASGPAGDTAYVAALGTATVIALDASTGALIDEIATGELPLGLVVDDARGLLYVYTLGDKTLRTYRAEPGHPRVGRAVPLAYDPEPRTVGEGRVHMYDARTESGAGTGNFSCASCHVFGHLDAMAWDLGDPAGGIGYFSPDLMTGEASFDGQKVANKRASMTHPMKGPMVTQSLRGLGDAGSKPFHWRGDRRFLQMFQGAFKGLLGGDGISRESMQQYAGFLRTLRFPPNPYQPRDRSYVGTEAEGADTFGMNPQLEGKTYNPLVPGLSCIDCHQGDFFAGTDFTGAQATVNFDGFGQLFNTGGLRGMYEKEARHLTGFGTSHDGSRDGSRGFLDGSPGGLEAFPLLTSQEKDEVTAFMLAWDTGLSPLVGVQHTTAVNPANLTEWLDFLALSQAQAMPPESNVDLIAKLTVHLPEGDVRVGAWFTEDPSDGVWRWLIDLDRFVDDVVLQQVVFQGVVEGSFAAVPPGLGRRLGVDRDEDGVLDGIEPTVGGLAHRPDSDGDGYDDGLELALGSKLGMADAFLAADVEAPVVDTVEVFDVFADAATLHVVLSEAGSLTVTVGTSPGGDDVGSFTASDLRRVHDVHLTGLPAGATLFFDVTAADRNGNSSSQSGDFDTEAPLYHVADMTIVAEGAGPHTVTATVTVVDQAGDPVVGLPVKMLWEGDLDGADFFPPVELTDVAGVSTHVLGPIDPAGPTTITATVVFVGTNVVGEPFFIGLGGDDPSFFYDQSSNAVNFRSVELP